MKSDITSREDIVFIITEFYKKLVADEQMLPFFEEIIEQNHLEEHIQTIADFWQDILLHTTSYKNNVLQKHLDFDKKVRFEKYHFERWLNYLIESIDTSFEGELAERMKGRAQSVAMVMQVKMNLYK